MDYDAYLGEIRLFSFNFAPMGWMPCDGAKLSVTQYTPLYSLITTKFGGDGKTNFALPDLRGKVPTPDLMYFIAVEGIYPVRM